MRDILGCLRAWQTDLQDSFARADKVLGRLFVDICREKCVASIERKLYMLLICNELSRITWTYFMRQKSDTVALFEQILADERVAETPSAVEVVRADEGGNSKEIVTNSVGGATSARSSLPLAAQNLTG